MLDLINKHPEHFMCAVLLISRLGDVISTRLATPNLRLEANPIVRWLGWKFALLTLLVCLFPYFSDWKAGLMLLVPSLLVAASNTGKIWMVRTMGEEEYVRFMLRLAGRSSLWAALLPALAAAGFVTLAGAVLWAFNPDPSGTAYWFAQGMMLYGLVVCIYGTLSIVRLFRRTRAMRGE